jgi:hypothetical protein
MADPPPTNKPTFSEMWRRFRQYDRVGRRRAFCVIVAGVILIKGFEALKDYFSN